ncbi:MAG TPA: hypothetical protein VML50_12865 [Anaeromyxobacter sp.]|nr:hypothetical protein [Anaeromyxobacter sp.]
MSRRRLGLLLVLGLALGCAGVREALEPTPRGEPSGRAGWLLYEVGGLRFEAPEGWAPSGGPRHLRLEGAGGGVRLEVSTPEEPFASETACMKSAEEALRRGDQLERARHHPTRFAGARALTLEGDQAGWHVWAWAACDGARQVQVFFTARSPASPEALEALRTLTASARMGGEA